MSATIIIMFNLEGMGLKGFESYHEVFVFPTISSLRHHRFFVWWFGFVDDANLQRNLFCHHRHSTRMRVRTWLSLWRRNPLVCLVLKEIMAKIMAAKIKTTKCASMYWDRHDKLCFSRIPTQHSFSFENVKVVIICSLFELRPQKIPSRWRFNRNHCLLLISPNWIFHSKNGIRRWIPVGHHTHTHTHTKAYPSDNAHSHSYHIFGYSTIVIPVNTYTHTHTHFTHTHRGVLIQFDCVVDDEKPVYVHFHPSRRIDPTLSTESMFEVGEYVGYKFHVMSHDTLTFIEVDL